MERKKRSKGRGWESCYVKKIYGTFGVEMRAYGQKLVKFCTHTHTRLSYSSNDNILCCFDTRITLFIMQSPVATVHPVKQGTVTLHMYTLYSNALENVLFLCILHI